MRRLAERCAREGLLVLWQAMRGVLSLASGSSRPLAQVCREGLLSRCVADAERRQSKADAVTGKQVLLRCVASPPPLLVGGRVVPSAPRLPGAGSEWDSGRRPPAAAAAGASRGPAGAAVASASDSAAVAFP